MDHRATDRSKTGQLKLFIASLWLTLATALFCAVVPTGLPQSASHGSAFNPSNNIVAVHSSAGTNRALLKQIERKNPAGDLAGADIVLPSRTATFDAPIAVAAVPPLPSQSTLDLRNSWSLPYARGPPAA
jgi:hypothetical protein